MNVSVLDSLTHLQDISQSDPEHLNFNSPHMIASFYLNKKIPAQSLGDGEDVESIDIQLKGKDDRVLDLQIKYVEYSFLLFL